MNQKLFYIMIKIWTHTERRITICPNYMLFNTVHISLYIDRGIIGLFYLHIYLCNIHLEVV